MQLIEKHVILSCKDQRSTVMVALAYGNRRSEPETSDGSLRVMLCSTACPSFKIVKLYLTATNEQRQNISTSGSARNVMWQKV